MLASTDHATMKVLTPTLAERLRIFNAAARTLQLMGVRLLHLAPLENKLTIEPEAGRNCSRRAVLVATSASVPLAAIVMSRSSRVCPLSGANPSATPDRTTGHSLN